MVKRRAIMSCSVSVWKKLSKGESQFCDLTP
uniref:Uncharacterized protein n=1 Tax=Anguilla anguilla TaxID=7936 RepID=A0A0E9V674_ANGAN